MIIILFEFSISNFNFNFPVLLLSQATVMEEWATAGVAKSKLVVGLPLYGRGWMLKSAAQHGLAAPSTAAITTSVHTGEAGSWPFFEICQRISTDKAQTVFDEGIQAAYSYTDTWWIGYDDQQTLKTKARFISRCKHRQSGRTD